MSHFTTVKTKLVVADYLKKSLTDLGYPFEEGKVSIRGYRGANATVDIKVPTGNAGYDIGFRKGKAGYEMVADWWGIKQVNQKTLIQRLSQRYAYHAAKDKLDKQGFELVAEEVQSGGRIHLVLRRMA